MPAVAAATFADEVVEVEPAAALVVAVIEADTSAFDNVVVAVVVAGKVAAIVAVRGQKLAD